MRPALQNQARLALAAVLLAALVMPAEARIVKTRRPVQVRRGLGLIVGSGFEYQSDGDESEIGFPFLLEWAVTSRLQLTAEPAYITIQSPEESVAGFDDLETSLGLDVMTERRNRPAVSIEGGIKWPTASDERIGSGVRDMSLGLLLSKDLVRTEVGLNISYSHVGLPEVGQVRNTVQFSLASEWPLGPDLSITSEVLSSHGVGGLRGTPDPEFDTSGATNVPGRGAGEYEATIGLARHFGRRLKVEPGFIVQTDGTWQAVLAWEWDFGEGR